MNIKSKASSKLLIASSDAEFIKCTLFSSPAYFTISFDAVIESLS